ncbi:MAG TPA: hypothetical protein DC054_07160 [Blastocatellia bacterium]|nr:hypothetical protein [Blastocatellia bacterium]
MLLRTTTAFISLILLVSIAASTRGQASISVTGSVSDPQSAPIPDARVTLYSLDRILQTKSDSSGRFKFDAVPIGKYEFEILAQGFKRFTMPDVFVTDLMRPTIPDKPTDLTAVMQIGPTGSPREIVAVAELAAVGDCGPPDSVTYGPRKTRDADALAGIVIGRFPKMAVPGATLQLFDAAGALIAQQQTNERGEFQFKQTVPGRYHILFQHPGYHNMEFREFWVARENQTYITLQALQLGKIVVCQ